MYAKDPATIVHEAHPFNAGPPPELLALALVTPTGRFFVRNHGAVPEVDPTAYLLDVGGLVARPLVLGLADLARLPRATVTATLQCAGNRRDELLTIAPIPGELPWGGEAIATATWSGVRLADLLQVAGICAGAGHVAFLGRDACANGDDAAGFGGSIPLAKALDPAVLLADTMNGAPLPPVHGAPLRVVVPGYIGARSVKWLAAISVQAEPSANYYQRHAYRLERGAAAGATGEGAMLGEVFVTARICTPAPGARVAAGPMRVTGYALGAGGAPLATVEVSADGGAAWTPARLLDPPARGVWQRWEATVTLPPGPHELAARATDSAGNTMPPSLDATWNPKGYMNNAWHHVRLIVVESL